MATGNGLSDREEDTNRNKSDGRIKPATDLQPTLTNILLRNSRSHFPCPPSFSPLPHLHLDSRDTKIKYFHEV
jgi:hypothetical protein